MNYIPYTYYVKWSSTGVWYYGCEYAQITKTANPSNLWKTYFTSSKSVKEYRELNGEPDILKITKTFSFGEEALLWEGKFLDRINAKDNPLSLNGHNSDLLYFKPKIVSRKTRSIQSKQRKKRKWWNNGEISLHAEFCPGPDFERGRILENNPGAYLGGEVNKLKRWYTNGKESIFIFKDSDIPDGFYEGRIIGKHKNPEQNRSKRRWFNDGNKDYFINPEETNTEFLNKGRLKESWNKNKILGTNNSIWITNGEIIRKIKLTDEIPEGFKRGRTRYPIQI